MPKSTNDEIVKRHAELRGVLIDKHALIAARKIDKLKKLTVEAVAAVIAEEFKASVI